MNCPMHGTHGVFHTKKPDRCYRIVSLPARVARFLERGIDYYFFAPARNGKSPLENACGRGWRRVGFNIRESSRFYPQGRVACPDGTVLDVQPVGKTGDSAGRQQRERSLCLARAADLEKNHQTQRVGCDAGEPTTRSDWRASRRSGGQDLWSGPEPRARNRSVPPDQRCGEGATQVD